MNSSNLAYVSKVTKIFDGNFKRIEDITRIILSDVDLNLNISKDEKAYDNALDMLQDRKTNYDKKIQALQFSNTSIKSIFLVKETEILGNSLLKENTFSEFFESEVYLKVQEAKLNPVRFSDLYDTNDFFVMRSINNLNTMTLLEKVL